jgi:ABC-2 type transport system ATP-binding protein
VVLGLASRAPLTIFDESYLGMDVPSRQLFYDALLADYAEVPRTIVLSTHLVSEVSAVLEEVVILDHGRLVTQAPVDSLRGRGAAIVGPAAAVDQVTAGLMVLSEQRLGGTKSSTVLGDLDDDLRARARDAGLEIGPVGLQDLFVHLTGSTKGSDR